LLKPHFYPGTVSCRLVSRGVLDHQTPPADPEGITAGSQGSGRILATTPLVPMTGDVWAVACRRYASGVVTLSIDVFLLPLDPGTPDAAGYLLGCLRHRLGGGVGAFGAFGRRTFLASLQDAARMVGVSLAGPGVALVPRSTARLMSSVPLGQRRGTKAARWDVRRSFMFILSRGNQKGYAVRVLHFYISLKSRGLECNVKRGGQRLFILKIHASSMNQARQALKGWNNLMS